MNIPFRILAIESSCDETACAVVEKKPDEELVTVIASTTATSLAKHKITQGIVPEVAAREQLKYILPVIEETLKKAGHPQSIIHNPQSAFDAIAVTVGPGLVGSLLVGIETARALAYAWNLPIIPVNHIQAHPYANFINVTNQPIRQLADQTTNKPNFPLISWVISGGHTELSYMESHDKIIKLGSTIDDAAGECFDKCARVLGFDYPGGPFIDKLANQVTNQPTNRITTIKLPRPLIHDKTMNMSFSGLKTAFARAWKDNLDTFEDKEEELKIILAHELQEAISDVILKRTQQALEQYPEVKSIIVSGGVAANSKIKEKLIASFQISTIRNPISLHFPPLSLCTDNAEMIGAWACFHSQTTTDWQHVEVKIKHN